MNKKRYLIIIVILLFLFLTIFSFANPFGNGNEKTNNKPLEEIEEEDLINKEEVKEETKPVVGPTYDNNQTLEDNSYELALEAVKKAEVTLSVEDYDKALVLVAKVKDKEKKEELEERLDEVLNSINVKELVEKLVKMTKESTNKKELDAAREFNTSNEIDDKISNLNNEILNETLQKAVDNIAYLLNDTKVPTINIEDGAILNSDTKIKVEDENEVTIVLNGTEIKNNYEVTDGVYELVVTDVAFNEVKISFTVDTKVPEGTLKYSTHTLTNKDVVVTLNTNEDVTVTNNDGKFEYTFTENGEFTFEFIDVAGNKGSVLAKVDYIDKTAPEVEVAYSNTKLTNKNVIVKLTLSEEIKEVEGWTLSENKMTLTKELEANEEGKVTVEDLAGNTKEVEYSVTNIDKTMPEAEVTYSTEKLTNENVIVTIILSEEVKEVEGWTLSENKMTLTKEVEANEEGNITIEDLAGNTIEVEYSVTNIDKKAPTVIGVRDGKYYKEATPVVEDENLESIKLNGIEIRSGKKILVNGNYTLVATDKAGNTTTVTFTVDSIKPIILVLDFLDVIKTDLIPIKPVIIDANLDTVTVLKDGVDIGYKQGDQLEGEGTYEIFAKDKAGNEAYTKFNADNSGPEIKKDGLIPTPIPVIGGVYKEVKILIEDDHFNENSILVLKKSSKSIELPFDYSLPTYNKIDFKYGDTLTEEGEYIVLVADNALNISYAMFTIDNTAPVVNVEEGKYYSSIQLKVEDATLLTTIVSKKSEYGIYVPTENTNGSTITEDGEYRVRAVDMVGNITTVDFIIDSSKPVIEGVENNGIYFEASPVVEDANLESVTVIKDDVLTEVKDKYTEEGIYTITAADKAGNTTTVSFEIDNEVLKINNIVEGTYYLESIIPEITHRGNIDITLNSEEYVEGTPITEAGQYTLVVIDEYNNKVSINFVVDLEAPTIVTSTLPSKVAAQDGKTTPVSVTVTDDADLDKVIIPTTITHSVKGNIEVSDKLDISKEMAGIYTLIYETSDEAGRVSNATATIEVVRNDISIEIITNGNTSIYNAQNQLSNITAHLVDEDGNEINSNVGDISLKVYTSNGNELIETELKNVGNYVIVATMNSSKPGYENILDAQIDYEIKPYELTVEYVLVSDSNEYDGYAKTYRPQVTTLEGIVTVGLNVTTSGANAGEYTLDADVTYSNPNYTIVDNGATVKIDQAILTTYFPSPVDGKVTPTFTNKSGKQINANSTVLYFTVTGNKYVPYMIAGNMSKSGQYKVMVIVDGNDNYIQDPSVERFNILGYSGVVGNYSI